MHTNNHMIVLDEVTGYTPTEIGVTYTDTTNTTVFIPITVLVRLYEGVKFNIERNDIDWTKFCDGLFKEE